MKASATAAFSALALTVACLCGCVTPVVEPRDDALTAQFSTARSGWAADVPTTAMKAVEKHCYKGIGLITDETSFLSFWSAFTTDRHIPRPAVDFTTTIVVIAYSPQYYNLCRIIGIDVNKGIANPIISSTRTSLPIQDKVYVSVTTMPREGVLAVISDDRTLKVPELRTP